jgi:protein disulfide-isomerase
MKTIVALLCFFAAGLISHAADAVTWSTDYQAALAQAKSEKRNVMLFFTGSDWCSWCKKLNKEILSTPEFSKYAAEKLILVELDFPRSKAQPAGVKAQNAKLQNEFKIEGYPTVIVLNNAGKKVGELGYQEGGPQPFIEALSKM